ncbi:MAG: MFS transporter, partial [Chloroflexota bacterium]|nr:MFS transporter [Chloroflexota bacterium]
MMRTPNIVISITSKPRFLLLLLAYLGFISLGLPDAVLGVAWPSIRETFGLSQSGLGAILIAGSSGYFLSSFGTGSLVRRLGVGTLLAVSTALVTLSVAGYAITPFWYLFLGCALLAGLGSGAIDAGLNAYAASHFSTRHMNWLHACWGLGATLG